MRSRRITLVLLAACSGGGDNPVSGDAGDVDAEAVPAAPYRIMAPLKIAASSSIRNRVLVIGTQPDGTPAHDELVLGFDRPGAGTFSAPVVTLGNLGATSFFSACELATPGCVGAVKLTAALASAPMLPVAELAVDIVDPIEASPARPCLGGGNVLYLHGDDQIFTGEDTITNATWTFDLAYPELLKVRVMPVGAAGTWTLAFDARAVGNYHIPDAYENAQIHGTFSSDLERDRPAMHVFGFGKQCSSVVGRYDVVDYDAVNNSARKVTIAFEQYCNGSTTNKLTGCIHYEQP